MRDVSIISYTHPDLPSDTTFHTNDGQIFSPNEIITIYNIYNYIPTLYQQLENIDANLILSIIYNKLLEIANNKNFIDELKTLKKLYKDDYLTILRIALLNK